MSELRKWLDQAAIWRTASLLLHSPTGQVVQQLQMLIPELPEKQRSALQGLPFSALEMWQMEYHEVLGPAGIPACESSYDTSALAGRGPLLAEVSGYYQAFAYRPESETPETPDHASVELGFLSYLALKVAFAIHQGALEDRRICEDAYWKFLEEHPRYWMGAFLERIAGTESVLYAAAALWIQQLLFADLALMAVHDKKRT